MEAAVNGAIAHSRHLKICHDTDCPAGSTAKLVFNRISQRGFSCLLSVTVGGDTFTATHLNNPTQAGAGEECIRQLDANLQWHFMSTRDLLATFEQPGLENTTFDLLLDELIRRRSNDAIPVLGRLLQKTTSMEIFSKTLGALVATGDPAAARVIIQSNRHRSPEIARQLVFALEELPCQESDNYLETLATGHPDRQVRAAAAIVLEGRKKTAPTTTQE